jgi:hypothetical protein
MQHFYKNIHGWVDHDLLELYSHAVQINDDNSHFIEIGSWKGKSASYMCVEIANSGKKIKFDCVDPWTGSEEHQQGKMYEDQDVLNGTLFDTFTKNMESVKEYYKAVRLPSVEAAKLYEDESLDFVFIDGAHDYDSVCADIKAWLPKVKPGKILSGHDWPVGGVKQAVDDILSINEINMIGKICWTYTKKQNV